MAWPNRATAAAITVTLTSLANGSAAASNAVSAGTGDTDHLVTVKTKGSGSADGYLNVYVLTSDAGSSETYSTDTLNSLELGILIGAVYIYTTNAVQAPAFSVAAACGGNLPKSYKLRFKNNSGAALSGTGGDHAVSYERIYST